MWRLCNLFVLTTWFVLGSTTENPPLGNGINIFSKYGHWDDIVRMIPTSKTTSPWTFKHPSIPIFKTIESKISSVDKLLHTKDVKIKVCKNVDELLAEFFSGLFLDIMNKPWTAFSSGWNDIQTANILGIDPEYLKGNHKYVIVRIPKEHERGLIFLPQNGLTLNDVAAEAFANMDVNSPQLINDFIDEFGSHYIHSYTTGDALYQVFVINENYYSDVKHFFDGQSSSDVARSATLYLAPHNTIHFGKIRTLSGNKTIETWAANKASMTLFNVSYRNIFSSLDFKKDYFQNEIDALLRDVALLKLELRYLPFTLPDGKKKNSLNNAIVERRSQQENNLVHAEV